MKLAKKKVFDSKEYMKLRLYKGIEIYKHYTTGLYYSSTTIDGYKKRFDLDKILDNQLGLIPNCNQLEIF